MSWDRLARATQCRVAVSFDAVRTLRHRGQLDRFHLASDVIDRLPRLGYMAAHARQAPRHKLIEHAAYIRARGEDMPEVREWRSSPVDPTQSGRAGRRSSATDNGCQPRHFGPLMVEYRETSSGRRGPFHTPIYRRRRARSLFELALVELARKPQ